MKIKVLAAVMIFFASLGCSPYQAAQIAIGLGGNLAGSLVKEALKPKPQKKVLITKEVEKLRIGYYNVGFYEGAYYGAPSILVIAQHDEQKTEEGKLLVFKRESYSSMQLLRDFIKLSESEKRQKIRAWYIEQHDFDLGPDTADNPAPSEPKPEPALKPPNS